MNYLEELLTKEKNNGIIIVPTVSPVTCRNLGKRHVLAPLAGNWYPKPVIDWFFDFTVNINLFSSVKTLQSLE